MKKFVYLAIGLIVIITIYLYASPYLALNNIKKAAQAGDADTLSEYIDFPSVKQGLKDQMMQTPYQNILIFQVSNKV